MRGVLRRGNWTANAMNRQGACTTSSCHPAPTLNCGEFLGRRREFTIRDKTRRLQEKRELRGVNCGTWGILPVFICIVFWIIYQECVRVPRFTRHVIPSAASLARALQQHLQHSPLPPISTLPHIHRYPFYPCPIHISVSSTASRRWASR